MRLKPCKVCGYIPELDLDYETNTVALLCSHCHTGVRKAIQSGVRIALGWAWNKEQKCPQVKEVRKVKPNVELKRCPFCGGEAILSTGGEHFVIPECKECGAKLPASFGTDKEANAVTLWNRRPVSEWLRHEDSNTWECTECHACFDLDGGTPKDKYLNYCPVCGVKLELPE